MQLNKTVLIGLFAIASLSLTGQAMASPYGNYPNAPFQNAPQFQPNNMPYYDSTTRPGKNPFSMESMMPSDNSKWGPAKWMNQMQNQLRGQNGQNGNIFQDAKGFYRLMGDGNTRYKFYFNFDVEMDMNAWMNLQNQANANARARHQAYQAQQRQLQAWQPFQTHSLNQWQPAFRQFPGQAPIR